jgi:hypothetical protein
MLKVLSAAPDVTVSLTSTILHARKQQVMSSVALAIEKLKAAGINIKLLLPLKSRINAILLQVRVPIPILHLSMARFLQNWHWSL